MGANRGTNTGDYWNGYWGWYDNTYSPYYQQSAPANGPLLNGKAFTTGAYNQARYGVPFNPNSNGTFYSGGYIGGTGMTGQTAASGQTGANLVGPPRGVYSGYYSGRGMFGPGSPQLQNGMVAPGVTAGGNAGRVPQTFGQHSGAFGPSSPAAQNSVNPVTGGAVQQGGSMQYGWW